MRGRRDTLRQLDDVHDVLVIGGGATGLGIALDSAARGYRTALVEARDFSCGTSSRSTKLVHGGVRYLAQGNIALVRQALRERRLLMGNAPHLVRELRFLVPCDGFVGRAFYGAGLRLYDALAGRDNLTPTRFVSNREAVAMVPTLCEARGGGVVYSDAQFNDSRLAVAIAGTAEQQGAALLNYARVEALLKERGRVSGAVVRDVETGATFDVRARVVVNATGVGTDSIRRMDEPGAPALVSASQGIHIVLDRSFLPGETAVMVPRTSDGRVFFVIPWEGRCLAGTTDTPVADPLAEPAPLDDEIEFVLSHTGQYLSRRPERSDVLSVFAGLRPLVRNGSLKTSRLSRDHTLVVSPSGLVTITGGKWTTYRKMARDTVDQAARTGGLPDAPCVTEDLRLLGADAVDGPWREFGAGPELAARYEERYPGRLHARLPYTRAAAAYVIQNESVLHLEDVLSRRLRALLLDARAAREAAPAVAALMAELQGRDAAWAEREVAAFDAVVRRHIINGDTADA